MGERRFWISYQWEKPNPSHVTHKTDAEVLAEMDTETVLREAVKRLLAESKMRETHPFGVPEDFHIGVGPDCDSMLLWPHSTP